MCDINISTSRLRDLIDNSGRTREFIAKEIGCDTSTVTKHYNGDRKITVDYIINYAKYFNVSSDYLLGISKIPTTDKDIEFICEYTGLSVEAIEIICKFFKDDVFQTYFNALICSKCLVDICHYTLGYRADIYDCIETYKEKISSINNGNREETERDYAFSLDLYLFKIQESIKEFSKQYVDLPLNDLEIIKKEYTNKLKKDGDDSANNPKT